MIRNSVTFPNQAEFCRSVCDIMSVAQTEVILYTVTVTANALNFASVTKRKLHLTFLLTIICNYRSVFGLQFHNSRFICYNEFGLSVRQTNIRTIDLFKLNILRWSENVEDKIIDMYSILCFLNFKDEVF